MKGETEDREIVSAVMEIRRVGEWGEAGSGFAKPVGRARGGVRIQTR